MLDLYLDGLQAHLGRRPRVVLQDVESFCEAAATVPQIRYDRLYYRRFDPAKIGRLFDLDSLADPLPALKQRLAAQLAKGGFLPLYLRGEALRDRAAGERTPLSAFPGRKPKLRYMAYRYLPPGLRKMVKGK